MYSLTCPTIPLKKLKWYKNIRSMKRLFFLGACLHGAPVDAGPLYSCLLCLMVKPALPTRKIINFEIYNLDIKINSQNTKSNLLFHSFHSFVSENCPPVASFSIFLCLCVLGFTLNPLYGRLCAVYVSQFF